MKVEVEGGFKYTLMRGLSIGMSFVVGDRRQRGKLASIRDRVVGDSI